MTRTAWTRNATAANAAYAATASSTRKKRLRIGITPSALRIGMMMSTHKKRSIYDGRPCIYCGRPANTIDHLIPKSRGGSNEHENLAPACLTCNRTKAARSLEEFLTTRNERKRELCYERLAAHRAIPVGPDGLKHRALT